MTKKSMRVTVLSSALASLLATPLAAQEAKSVNLLEPHGGLMFWTLIIFVVLMFVLTKFAFKPLIAAVEAREKSLADALDAAKREREQAHALLEQQQKNLDAARAEAQRIIVDGRNTAEKMRNDMLEQTRAAQTELLERAKREIEGEKLRAIADLRREAVDLAIAGASKVIERNLDDQSNRRLVESFLSSLSTSNAKR